ncbi:MAG: EAL domain-containing protein [Alphaproteobacteria bacterium]|nr:EAL domain-containing protein [Alphaproteobacteria bacterium]
MSPPLDNPPQHRDRFLAFAFAASDMLIETGLDGIITFATGAFRMRLGADPGRYIGQRITSLIAAADQASLAMGMATVTLRGRIPPLVLRLADAAATPIALSAMMMAGPPARLCFTIGPVPALPGPAEARAPGFEEPLLFVREAELALRSGAEARVGLLELENWQDMQSLLPPEDMRALRAGISAILAEAGPGVVAGEIGQGRYGLLGNAELDVAALAGKLRDFVGTGPAAKRTKVNDTDLPLTAGKLTPGQAARTLRFAVTRFAAGGTKAAELDGTAGGLAGIIARSEHSARSMRDAIAAKRFRLQFQPIVSLADNTVHHFEALLRPLESQSHPSGTTQDFVLFAEMVGLAEELDLAVLVEALAAVRDAPAASVAVNVSGFTMQSPAFRDVVAGILAANADIVGLDHPHRLLVELTETAEIEDMPAAAAAIAALRAQGVPVCLDDFGAGGAAFRYLREFGVDFVKIDGLYVRAAVRGARERGFVASMVELAGSVGAQVVAEMIETVEQAALMRELGVQFGQGWLFGRPGALQGARR